MSLQIVFIFAKILELHAWCLDCERLQRNLSLLTIIALRSVLETQIFPYLPMHLL